ncbi:MAG: C39 family peptidase [Breznakia sp.]
MQRLKRERNYETFFMIVIAVILVITMFIVGTEYMLQKDEVRVALQMNKQYLFKEDADTLYNQLAQKYSGNPKMVMMLNEYEEYPQELKELALRNEDAISYVQGYKYKTDEVDNDLSELDTSKVAVLMQWDRRWGYATYGNEMFGLTGCGPTVLSMAAIYLSGNTEMTPYRVSQMSMDKGYYINHVGSSWSLMDAGAAQLGLRSSALYLHEESMLKALENGSLIVASLGPGDFTNAGHFILIVGVNETGEFIIRDPNSYIRTEKTWSFETLQKQILGMWRLSK